jgi:CTP:molybdopterin cytidylyltransferase MocA
VITGVVLAAGAGRRLGRPKAELVVGGRRLIDRAVSTLRAGGCDNVLVVVRSSEVTAPDAVSVVNSDSDEGMGSSLRVGLAAVESDACVIVLVDQLGIASSDIAMVIEAFRDGAEIVVARRAGMRSHPVLVSRAWFDDFAAAAVGDRGAREFLDARADMVNFVDFEDEISDIDTPQDLAAARSAWDA